MNSLIHRLPTGGRGTIDEAITVAHEEFVVRKNIARYRRLLSTLADDKTKKSIAELLAAETKKLLNPRVNKT